MEDNIIDQIIDCELYLEPYYCNNSNDDINNIIIKKLKEKFEGLCYKNGFIFKDTIELIKKNIGKIEIYNNQSIIKYNIKFNCKMICPSEGDKMDVYINNKNKMGLISYIKIKDFNIHNFEDSPLIIIIPLEYLNESNYNINDININQKMNIEILGKRIKFNSNKIQLVAKIS